MSGFGGKTKTSGQGRPKGVPNKLTGDIKAMVVNALNRVGGEKYLAKQATENPAAFMSLVGRVLPTQITGAGGGPVIVVTGVERASDAVTGD